MNGEEKKAKKFAERLLSKRAYTSKKLMRRLRSRKFSEEVSVKIVEIMEEYGLIDDKFYAICFAETHQEWGKRRILLELQRRGISEDIREEIREKLDEEEELSRCIKLASDWSGYLSKEQLKARLMRRGFAPSVVKRVVDMTCGDVV